MTLTSSLKKSITDISIFSRILTDDIYDDPRFEQLMNLLYDKENLYKYTYCFYCDESHIKNNLFIPVFHTAHLSCKNNNVIIKDKNDLWLLEIFSQNQYYILSETKDSFDYETYNVKTINNIKDIWESNEL